MRSTATSNATTRSRTSDIYDRIRDDIIHGQLAPGSKLKIDLLREHYDVGATPLREALSLLTADGLVERLDQRGFRVPEGDRLRIRRAPGNTMLAGGAGLASGNPERRQGLGGRHRCGGCYRLSRTPRVSPDVSQASNLEYERCHKAFT